MGILSHTPTRNIRSIRATGLWQLAIIERPSWWRPDEWSDAPERATLLEVERDPVELEFGIGAVCAHNFGAIKHRSPAWAVLVPYDDKMQAGDECTQFCTQLAG